MLKLAAGIVITVLVLAVAGAAALADRPVDAGSSEDAPAALPPLRAAVQTQPVQGAESSPLHVTPNEEEHPFIGIAVFTIGNEAARHLEITGGVKVTRVLPDGPSADILKAGDIILAINGTEVADIEGLRETIQATGVGYVISISILREGQTIDVTVTAGDRSDYDEVLWPVTKHVLAKKLQAHQAPNLLGGILPQLWAMEDKLVRAEVVLETQDGFKTFTAAKGTLSDIDVENGTFTLVPKDGSDPISYEISEETIVGMGHEGDLGGLNTEDETLVVAIDGELKLVFQGKLMQDHLPAGLSPFGLKVPLPQSKLGGSLFHDKILTDSLIDRIKIRVKTVQIQ